MYSVNYLFELHYIICRLRASSVAVKLLIICEEIFIMNYDASLISEYYGHW